MCVAGHAFRFFEDYKKNENKMVRVDEILGAAEAVQTVKEGLVSEEHEAGGEGREGWAAAAAGGWWLVGCHEELQRGRSSTPAGATLDGLLTVAAVPMLLLCRVRARVQNMYQEHYVAKKLRVTYD